MKLIRTAFLAMFIAAPVAAQQHGHRQAAAHEHGIGALDVALEGNTLELMLRAPGADIVGFEHEAKSDEDRARAEAAREKLASPLSLFSPPLEAGCEVGSVEVELEGLAKDHHASDRGKHAHDDHEKSGKHAHDDHEKGARTDSHSEYHAHYRYTCSNPAALTHLALPYFEAFPNARELEVRIVSATGATKAEVERDEPRLELEGRL